jgi:hypothetical protein
MEYAASGGVVMCEGVLTKGLLEAPAGQQRGLLSVLQPAGHVAPTPGDMLGRY